MIRSVDGQPRHPPSTGMLILCLEGELPRGAVAGVLGLKGTAARAVICRALDEELVCSSSEKGPQRIAFPP